MNEPKNNPAPIIVKNGLGRERNPYGSEEPRSDWTRGDAAVMAGAVEQNEISQMQQTYWGWKQFEATVQSYPVIGDVADGEYEGELVWQMRARQSNDWNPFKYKVENIASDNTYMLNGLIYYCRQAYKIIPPAEKEDNIPVNALHVSCPECGCNFDVIPDEGTCTNVNTRTAEVKSIIEGRIAELNMDTMIDHANKAGRLRELTHLLTLLK